VQRFSDRLVRNQWNNFRPENRFLKLGLRHLQAVKSPRHGGVDAVGESEIAEVVELIRQQARPTRQR